MKALILLCLVSFSVMAEDSGLKDAILHSNIKQIVPQPHIRFKGSFVYKEPLVCEVNPMSGSLLVTINPHSWYALKPVEQINTFCEEMNRCYVKIKCKKI